MPRCGSKMQSFLAWASPSDAITEGILGTPGLISNSPHAADTSCLCTKTTPLSLGPTPSPRRWKEVPTEIPAGCSSPQKASVARRGAAAVCDASLHRELLLLDTDRFDLYRLTGLRMHAQRLNLDEKYCCNPRRFLVPGSDRSFAFARSLFAEREREREREGGRMEMKTERCISKREGGRLIRISIAIK
jgi:hypothetical protein